MVFRHDSSAIARCAARLFDHDDIQPVDSAWWSSERKICNEQRLERVRALGRDGPPHRLLARSTAPRSIGSPLSRVGEPEMGLDKACPHGCLCRFCPPHSAAMVKAEMNQTPSASSSSAKRRKTDDLEQNGTKKKPRTRVRYVSPHYTVDVELW